MAKKRRKIKLHGPNPKPLTPTYDDELAKRCVDLLNNMYEIDPVAAEAFVKVRFPINERLANHPVIQSIVTHNGFFTSMLGFLNGLCGVDRNGQGFISARFADDSTQSLIGFCLNSGVENDATTENPGECILRPGT